MQKLEDKQIHQNGRPDALTNQRNEKGDTVQECEHEINSRSRTDSFRRTQIGDGRGESLMETLKLN